MLTMKNEEDPFGLWLAQWQRWTMWAGQQAMGPYFIALFRVCLSCVRYAIDINTMIEKSFLCINQ